MVPMKRLALFFMVLCLLLCGCGKRPGTDTQLPSENTTDIESTPVETPEPTPSEPEYSQLPLIAVSVPAVIDYAYNGSGDAIFRHTRQNMMLVLQDPEIADKIIVDFLNRIEETTPQAQIVYDAALECEEAPPAPYSFDLLYNPTRIDQSVLSLYGTQVSWSGGIHPNYVCISANYDMVTGDVLTLGSILDSVDAIDPLYDLILDELQNMEEDCGLFPGYQETVHDMLFGEESYNETWYFSASGLCFYFSPYEIAPYASGIITVELPYESLTGIIGDGFFPPERDTASGVVCASRMQDIQLDQFTQIAEVIIDQGGEKVFIYTEQAVYDVRLEVGYWDETMSEFYPSYIAFAAYTLTPGDAIMAETYIPDVLPSLRLTYTSGNETVSVFIHQSGQDGSIYLMDG